MKLKKSFEKNELVICKNLINRWNLPCTGEIQSMNEDGTFNIFVYNLYGPGANTLVKGIPSEDIKRCKT